MFDNLVSGVLLKKENNQNWLIKEMVHLQKKPNKKPFISLGDLRSK
jgi:hypothetical protein